MAQVSDKKNNDESSKVSLYTCVIIICYCVTSPEVDCIQRLHTKVDCIQGVYRGIVRYS